MRNLTKEPTTKLVAYNNDPELKKQLLTLVRWHQKHDRLIKGSYIEDTDGEFRGCAVGCTIESYRRVKDLPTKGLRYGDHARYEEFGIPAELARLEDALFEAMPAEHSQAWPYKFLASIPVGADLSRVLPQFIVWTLSDHKEGIVAHTQDQEVKDIAQALSDLFSRVAQAGDWSVVSTEEWKAIKDLADRADRAYLAYLADRAYLAYLAYLADRCSKKLLELLKASSVPVGDEVTEV